MAQEPSMFYFVYAVKRPLTAKRWVSLFVIEPFSGGVTRRMPRGVVKTMHEKRPNSMISPNPPLMHEAGTDSEFMPHTRGHDCGLRPHPVSGA